MSGAYRLFLAVRYVARLLRIVQRQALKRKARRHLSTMMDPEWQEVRVRRHGVINLKRSLNTSGIQLKTRRNAANDDDEVLTNFHLDRYALQQPLPFGTPNDV